MGLFKTFRMPPPIDPCPHALTDEERAHIEDRLGSGAVPRARVVRKLVRICDERLDIIRHLEAKR